MLLRFASAICLLAPLCLCALDQPAIDAEQQIKAALSALADPKSKQAIGLWNTLGTIHQMQAKFLEAEQDYRRALALNDGAIVATEVSIINNLATLLQAKHNYKAADVLLRHGYELLQKNGLSEAIAAGPLLANLGLNLHQMGQLSEAEQKYQQAESFFERPELSYTADRVLFLSNFGLLDFEIGHYADGLLHARQAVEIEEKLPSGSTQHHAYVLNNLGLGLSSLGRFAEAESSCFGQSRLRGVGHRHRVSD